MLSWIKKLFSKKTKSAKNPLKDGQRASEEQMRREMEKLRDGTFNEPARDARRSHPGTKAGRL